jgi:hypothetical protein
MHHWVKNVLFDCTKMFQLTQLVSHRLSVEIYYKAPSSPSWLILLNSKENAPPRNFMKSLTGRYS